MGSAALSWAKQQRTGSPTCKLVLLAIADAMRDDFQFYGSIEKLSEVTELGRRTVQRSIQHLVDAGILTQEIRPGRTSLYRLNDDDGKKSGRRGVRATPVSERHPCQSDMRQSDTRGCQSDTRTHTKPPLICNTTTTARATVDDAAEYVVSGRDQNQDVEKLAWPNQMSEIERRHAEQSLAGIEPGARQQIVDVLASSIQAGKVRSPVGMLRAMVERFHAGTFDPGPGLAIAGAREHSQKPTRRPPAIPEPDTDTVLREHARRLGVDPDEYLARFGRKQA